MTEAAVLTTREGDALHIILNRPKALNSLSAEMVTLIDQALDVAEADDSIRLVTITGAGDRAFCAGGDIRFLTEARASGNLQAAAEFWADEYRLNARIAEFPKPYIALIDGICMGGGVGVSAHGSLRIVTDKAKIAMPETGIGFVPDVGATWILTRENSPIARYMALTGATVGPADAIASGLADICVRSADLPAVSAALAAGKDYTDFLITPDAGIAAAHKIDLGWIFQDDDLGAIMARLAASDSDFASETTALLAQKSPTSLTATAYLLAQARKADSLQTCLNAEYHAALGALEHPDFTEGVRAAIIDKDRNPRWTPATLDAVRPEDMVPYLAPKSGAPFAARQPE